MCEEHNTKNKGRADSDICLQKSKMSPRIKSKDVYDFSWPAVSAMLCCLSVETQKTSSEQIKLRNRNTEVHLQLTGFFYQHPTLLHKTNPAWAAEPRWKWLSCLKTAGRVNVSVLKTRGLQARATPASREGKLRSSRSFILPLNWQNRGTIYASNGSSAGGGALRLPSSHPVNRLTAARYELFGKSLHRAWSVSVSPSDHPTHSRLQEDLTSIIHPYQL